MKKILFNDRYGLTDAVIEGRKTMTRRPVSESLWEEWTDYDDFCNSVIGGIARGGTSVSREYYRECDFFKDKCRYKVGEVVPVAQSYRDIFKGMKQDDSRRAKYAGEKYTPGYGNKMYVRADMMIEHIRITGIRCERLQDISDEDCVKEGVRVGSQALEYPYYFIDTKQFLICDYKSPRRAFAALIDKVSGRGTWDRNPWVVAYEFELVK